MKKFRQLIRECGEGTVMYNHLHMNLLKAGLVRTRGLGTAGRSRSRGRGRGRGRGRARQLYAAAAAGVPSTVHRPLPDRTDQHSQSRDAYEVNDLTRHSQTPQAPVDLVKRNDFPHETSENHCLNLSQNRRDGPEMINHYEPIKSQQIGLQDGVHNPLNLVTHRGCSFAGPRQGTSSFGPAKKSPVFRPFENEMLSPVTNQVFQNSPRSGGVISSCTEPSRASPRSAPNVGIAFVKEIVDCIFPELIYRPLAAEGREYLEVTPREATLLPVSSNHGDDGTPNLCPCYPARILVSPEGKVEFQAAFKILDTVHALPTSVGGGDSTAWRKSVLECVHGLTAQAGYRFCPGIGQAVPSVGYDDIVSSDFGLGFRSASCELWYRPQPRDGSEEVVLNLATSARPLEGAITGASSSTTPGLERDFGDEENVESTALFMSDELGACSQCFDAVRQSNLARQKQRNPRKVKQ